RRAAVKALSFFPDNRPSVGALLCGEASPRCPMNPPIKTARELFVAAVKQAPNQWDAYLAEACAGDEALRRRRRDLLAAHREAGSFLEPPAPGPAATTAEAAHEDPGTVVGVYQLLEPLGEGGMGTVWLAQQTEPVQRLVALKVIKPGMDSRQV